PSNALRPDGRPAISTLSCPGTFKSNGLSSPLTAIPASDVDEARRGVLFEMVTALCEQAWVLRDRTDEIAANQWPGWEGFIITLLEHPAYREYLDLDRVDGRLGGYDSRYETYLKSLINTRNLGAISKPSSASPIPA
ncbi:hypothetical protein EV132_1651, partial [Rhizobium sullae]